MNGQSSMVNEARGKRTVRRRYVCATLVFLASACAEPRDATQKPSSPAPAVTTSSPSAAAWPTASSQAAGSPADKIRELRWAMKCQENLIKLEGAMDQWAIEYDKKKGTTVPLTALVGRDLYLKEKPVCPGGGHYPEVFTVGKPPTCDYKTPQWFDTQGDKFRHRIPEIK